MKPEGKFVIKTGMQQRLDKVHGLNNIAENEFLI